MAKNFCVYYLDRKEQKKKNQKRKKLCNSFEDNYIFYLTKKYYEKYKDRNYSTINKLRKTEKK